MPWHKYQEFKVLVLAREKQKNKASRKPNFLLSFKVPKMWDIDKIILNNDRIGLITG